MYEKWFGRVLKAWRKKRDLTQHQLGVESGLGRNLVGELERGRKAVEREEFFSLCRTLKINPSAFVSEVGVALLEELRGLEGGPPERFSDSPEGDPGIDHSGEFEKDLDSFLEQLKKIVLHLHEAASRRSLEAPKPPRKENRKSPANPSSPKK